MKALAVAAGIVFWTLVLGIAWLAFFAGGDSGEPVAILQIEPATTPSESAAPDTPPVTAPESSEPQSDTPQASTDGVDLPPGFGMPAETPQEPMVEPPGVGQQGSPVMPMGPGGQAETPPQAPDDAAPPEGTDQQGAAPNASGMQQAAVEGPTAAVPPPPPSEPEPETGAIALEPAPVAELVEESQYGPLPKIAADGRRPIDVYSRHSNFAKATPSAPPRVAVLVTGLGLPNGPAADVLKGLPPQISVAYGAYGRSLQDGVSKVRGEGHEVLLQIPLEPENYPATDPGPHTLLTTLPPEDNLKRLQWLMSRYTGYVGVTNHMGAKFEAAQASLAPVLEELKRRGLLYVDDGGQTSTAGQIAGTIGLDYSAVSVQLDGGNVAGQLAQLEAAAKQRGAAIGVAKASSATVKQIADWAGKLEAKGIKLVPVSAAVRSQQQG
jgi:polysaccharide deacetylase 2 family uncharacterized protein YibQ